MPSRVVTIPSQPSDLHGRGASLGPNSLWVRLLLLILTATLPMLVLLVVSGVLDSRHLMQREQDRVVAIARLAAEQQDNALSEAGNVLRVLSSIPEITASPERCSAVVQRVVKNAPQFNAISFADPTGAVHCSSNPAAVGLDASDRAYFKTALNAPRGAAVTLSRLVVGRPTGLPGIFAALAVYRPGIEEPAGVLIVTMPIEWFARKYSPQTEAQDMAEVIDTRDSTVLARYAGGTYLPASEQAPFHPVLAAFRAKPEGGTITATVMGPDGAAIDRLYGYAALPAGQGALLLAVGVDVAEVHAIVALRIMVALVFGLIVLVLAIACSFLSAQRTILGPLDEIVAAASAIGSGDLVVPPRLPRGSARELRVLVIAFIAMARRLRTRDERIAAMQARLQASVDQHLLLASASNDIITRFSPDLHRLYVSPASQEVLGYAPEEMVGTHYAEFVCPEDWPQVLEAITAMMHEHRATVRIIYRAMRRGGQTIWVEGSARRLPDDSGFVLVARDVTNHKALEEQLGQANRRLRVLAWQDGLTGVANRRRFDEALGQEYRRALRQNGSLALVMLDVDHFKRFNDAYGHLGGDSCLQRIAAALVAQARRPADLPARYGGEEFAVLLPDTDIVGAHAFADGLQAALADLAIPHEGNPAGRVSVSIGIACTTPEGGDSGPAELIEAADAALYRAKAAGRNRVERAPSEAMAPTR